MMAVVEATVRELRIVIPNSLLRAATMISLLLRRPGPEG